MPRSRFTRRDFLKGGLLVAGAAGAGVALEFLGPPLGRDQMAPTRDGRLPWKEARKIVAEAIVPSFPQFTLSVANSPYGARGDGSSATVAITRAIEDCSASGGGHVVVPAGVYSTGAIRLLSNVDLHLEKGALLRFSGNANEYPLVLTRYEGIECMNHSPMIYAYGENNIALTGAGVLDASETRSWNSGSHRDSVLEPLVAGGVPPERRIVPDHGRLRSTFVEPYRCTNVLIQDIALRQSQFWQLHPTLCRNVTVDSVTTGDTSNPNTDGCNPESCDHVVIRNSVLDAGDDCIGIKAGRDADGRRVNAPCENVVVMNCKLKGPAGGIACGSEMTGGVRNIYAFDVETHGAGVEHMLYVKSNTRRGGFVENINFDSVRADDSRGAWAFAQMDYDGQAGEHPPRFEDWTIIRSSGDFAPWILELRGLPGNPIRRVDLMQSRFTHVLLPLALNSNVEGLNFESVTINGWPAFYG